MNTSSISLIAQLQDGSSRPAAGDEIVAAARERMSRRVRRCTQLTSPKATRDYLSLKLGSLEREVFTVTFSINGIESSAIRRCSKAPSTEHRFIRGRS